MCNKVFVGLSIVPVLGGFFAEPKASKHSQQIVPKSHEKGPNTEKGPAAGRLGFDGLDLQDQLPIGAFLQSVGGDCFDAWPDPLPVHHALTGSTLALPTTILNVLSSLRGYVSNGLTGPCHAGPRVVSLPKDNRNVSLEADPGVTQGSNIPSGIRERFLLDPFWYVWLLFIGTLLLLLPGLRGFG